MNVEISFHVWKKYLTSIFTRKVDFAVAIPFMNAKFSSRSHKLCPSFTSIFQYHFEKISSRHWFSSKDLFFHVSAGNLALPQIQKHLTIDLDRSTVSLQFKKPIHLSKFQEAIKRVRESLNKIDNTATHDNASSRAALTLA